MSEQPSRIFVEVVAQRVNDHDRRIENLERLAEHTFVPRREIEGDNEALAERITNLEAGQKWTIRTVLGAVITLALGGLATFMSAGFSSMIK